MKFVTEKDFKSIFKWSLLGLLNCFMKSKFLKKFNTNDLSCTFSFLDRGIILWIELPQPENPANTCMWHTETLDSCFDLIRSHLLNWFSSWFGITCLQCGLVALSGRVSPLLSVVAGSTFSGGDHGIRCWWDLIRSKQLSSVSICHVQVFTNDLKWK